MRIILILLATLPLAAMWYDIYVKREQQQREDTFLAAAEDVVIDALEAATGQQILDPIVISPERNEPWSLRGKLILAEADSDAERRRIGADFEQVCEETEEPACWHLVRLTVDGEARPIGEQAADDAPAETPAAAAQSAETPAADGQTAEPGTAEAEPMPAEPAEPTPPATEAAAPAVSEPMVPTPEPADAEPAPEPSVAEAAASALVDGGGSGSDSLPLAAAAAEPAPDDAAATTGGADNGGVIGSDAPVALNIPLAADDEVDGAEDAASAEAPAPETEAPQVAAVPEAPEATAEAPAPAAPDAPAAAEPAPPAEETPEVAALPEPPDNTAAEDGTPDDAAADEAEADEAEADEATESNGIVPWADPALVANIQSALNTLGFGQPRPLKVDGVLGPQTLEAIRSYRRSEGLGGESEVTPELLAHMASRMESETSTQAAPASPAAEDAGTTENAAPAVQPAPIADESLVYLIQDRLMRLGYGGSEPLARDGKLDRRTVALITAYQQEHALAGDGAPTEALLDHMESSLRRKNQRSSASGGE